MKDSLKILLGFLPWILFGILAGPSLTRLEAALAVSLAATLALGLKQLRQGFFLTWGSLLFFFLSFILVAFLKNLWVVEHMDLLVPGDPGGHSLGLHHRRSAFCLAIRPGKRAGGLLAAPRSSSTPVMSFPWSGESFLLALGASLFRSNLDRLAGWLYSLLGTGSMFLGIIFTQWYVHRVEKPGKPEKS